MEDLYTQQIYYPQPPQYEEICSSPQVDLIKVKMEEFINNVNKFGKFYQINYNYSFELPNYNNSQCNIPLDTPSMKSTDIIEMIKVSKDEYIEYYTSKLHTNLSELNQLSKDTIHELKLNEISINFKNWYEMFISRNGKVLIGKLGIVTSFMTFLFGISHGNVFLITGLGGTVLSSGYLLWNRIVYNKDKEVERYNILLNSLKNF
jgi:hypothetical protein